MLSNANVHSESGGSREADLLGSLESVFLLRQHVGLGVPGVDPNASSVNVAPVFVALSVRAPSGVPVVRAVAVEGSPVGAAPGALVPAIGFVLAVLPIVPAI